MCRLASSTLTAASSIHAEMVVKLRACSINCVAAVPYPSDTVLAVFPCSSPILEPASVALSDCTDAAVEASSAATFAVWYEFSLSDGQESPTRE